MGGLSVTHLILIAIILLVFFGPSRLPGLGKSVGEAIRGFKKGLNSDEIDVTDASPNRNESLRTGQTQPNQAQSNHHSQSNQAISPPPQTHQQAHDQATPASQGQRDPSRDGRS